MKTKILLRTISVSMIIVAIIFIIIALCNPTLGTTYYVGVLKFDSTFWNIFYLVYLICATLLFILSFLNKNNLKLVLSNMFTTFAIILSYIMCIVIAYNYRHMICGIKHMGYSAPANIVFLYTIPFLIIIIFFLLLAKFLKNKHNK